MADDKYNQLIDKMKNYFCPAGQGVHTVHTAKQHRELLQKNLYGGPEKAEQAWRNTLKDLPNSPAITFGLCCDTGGGIQRGANWGPLFIRNQVLSDFGPSSLTDMGDIRVIPHLLHDKYLNQETISQCQQALYGQTSKLPVSPLSIAEDFLTDLYQIDSNKKIFVLGGDHSVSYSLTIPYLKAKKKAGVKTAIIHFDAHTDLLDRRLGIDINFGSWAFHSIEHLPSPELLIQIGIRSSNHPKEHWQKTLGVTQHWAHEVKKQGAKAIAENICQQLTKAKVDELYLSFDIDALDSKIAGATGTPEPGGLTTEDCQEIISIIGKNTPFTAADLVEVAPFVRSPNKEDSTLEAAAQISQLIASQLT